MNLRSLAVSSFVALLMVGTAHAATRPRYGGTLRVEMRAPMSSLDPKEDSAAPLVPLVFDTLVTLDSSARPQPALAVSWNAENEKRWRFTLRRGVKFSDGSVLTAATVATSLHETNPDWSVRDVGDVVIIETEQPCPNLPAQLALPANAIVLRGGDKLVGTGAFTVADWQPGVRVILQARDDGWHPRPFLERIEVVFNRTLREQSVDLEAGRADVIELSPEESARSGSSRRIMRSDPVLLYALRFSHTNTATKDLRVREAVSVSIDRDSIANILLQRRGEACAGLLPNWMTGYSFLFSTQPQVPRARQLRTEARFATPMTLVYRSADPLARLIAERVALNAADAGLSIRTAPDTQNIAVPDIELIAVRLPSADAMTALAAIARPGVLALPYAAPSGDSPDDEYRATGAALKDSWAAPIAYAPIVYGLSARVANWSASRTGAWQLEDVSLTQPDRPEVRP